MIELPIDFVRPGDIVAKDQRFKRYDGGMSSEVNLMKGYRISERVIEKLRNDYNVDFLCVSVGDDTEDEIIYEEGLGDVARKRIVTDFHECVVEIESAGVVDLKRLRQVVQSILSGVSEAIGNDRGSLKTLSSTFSEVKSHDAYTWEHSVNSAIYAAAIALSDPRILDETRQRESANRFSKAEILVFNMLLHDVGKLRIPLHLLNKHARYTSSEFEQIKRHPYAGVVYIRKMNDALLRQARPQIPSYFMQACLYHHQSFDGSGYPALSDGNGGVRTLIGKEIPVIGRIATVADVYDAVSSNRPYRLPYHPERALRYLLDHKGKKLDPAVADAFASRITPYPKGTTVNLSTGELAVVVGSADTRGLEPIVRPILRKVRTNGKERIIKLKGRDEITITPSSKVQIVINSDLYYIDDDEDTT